MKIKLIVILLCYGLNLVASDDSRAMSRSYSFNHVTAEQNDTMKIDQSLVMDDFHIKSIAAETFIRRKICQIFVDSADQDGKRDILPNVGQMLLGFDWDWQLEQSYLEEEYFEAYQTFEKYGGDSDELEIKTGVTMLQACNIARRHDIKEWIEKYFKG